jgi:hypothetical protein
LILLVRWLVSQLHYTKDLSGTFYSPLPTIKREEPHFRSPSMAEVTAPRKKVF